MTRVLVTNDDGLGSPGLQVLAQAARDVFDEVLVVAPATEMSAVSHALSLHSPLRFREVSPGVWSVGGTPVDCVLVGIGHLWRDQRPDLVLSGVNRGPNLGYDVYYSGTVGAAREGHIKGIPSVALSLTGPDHYPFEDIAPAVRRVLEMVRDEGVPKGCLLNVNIPDPGVHAPGGGWAGVPGILGTRATRIGQRSYRDEVIVRTDPRGTPYAWIGGPLSHQEQSPGTDWRAVLDGYVSVTPLHLDNTDFAALEGLGRWNDGPPAQDSP